MPTLTEILYKQQDMFDMIEDRAGEVDEITESSLFENKEALINKTDSCLCVLQSLENDKKNIEIIEQKLKKAKKILENRTEKFKEYLGDTMAEFEIQKLVGKTGKLTHYVSKRVESVDLDCVPEEYLTYIAELNYEQFKKTGLKVDDVKKKCNASDLPEGHKAINYKIRNMVK